MKRSNDFVVGAVVLLGIAAIVGATLWMKQADIGRKRERIVARFRDVGNLKVGSDVVIRGVRAGRVEAIELADGGWVHVHSRLDPEVSLPRDPVVLLGQSSLFGDFQAVIQERSAIPRNRDVQDELRASGGAPGTLAGATLPDIAQLTTVAGQIAGDVASVADRVQLAFDSTAATELRRTIRHFSESSQNLSVASRNLSYIARTQSRNLDSLAVDIRDGVSNLKTATESFQRTVDRIDESTARGEVKQIVDDMEESARTLRQFSEQLRDISVELARSQQGVAHIVGQADSLMTKANQGTGSLALILNNPSLYQNSDSLLREIRSLVADIKTNPKRYINVKVF